MTKKFLLGFLHVCPSVLAVLCSLALGALLWLDIWQVRSGAEATFGILGEALDIEVGIFFLVPGLLFLLLSIRSWRRRVATAARLHHLPQRDRPHDDRRGPHPDNSLLERLRRDLGRERQKRWRELLVVERKRALVRSAIVITAYTALALVLIGVPRLMAAIGHTLYGMWPGVVFTVVLAVVGFWALNELPGRLSRRATMRDILVTFLGYEGDQETSPITHPLANEGFVHWLDLYWPRPFDHGLHKSGLGVALEVDGFPACVYTDRSGIEHVYFLISFWVNGRDERASEETLSGDIVNVFETYFKNHSQRSNEPPEIRDICGTVALLTWAWTATLTAAAPGLILTIDGDGLRRKLDSMGVDADSFFNSLIRRQAKRRMRRAQEAFLQKSAQEFHTVFQLLMEAARFTHGRPMPPLRREHP